MEQINQLLTDSFNSNSNLVYLLLRKMPKDNYNLLKQKTQNKTSNANNFGKNDNSLYNQTQNVTNNGFSKNKNSISKVNSSHQRNHSFSEIFLKYIFDHFEETYSNF